MRWSGARLPPETEMPVDPTLLDPYDRLVSISVAGQTFQVPANNSILRVLQYLDVDLYPCRLCWNGECDNCRFAFVDPSTGQERMARGCESLVFDGLKITRLPE